MISKKHNLLSILLGSLVISSSVSPAMAGDQNPQSVQAVDQKSNVPSNQPTSTAPPTGTGSQSLKPVSLQAEVDYWIDPDRPHIADSSVNVPKGLWLQENGFQQTYAKRNSGAFDFPETLVRLGISSHTELRYNTPNFITTDVLTENGDLASTRSRSAGFQNMQAGFKTRLGPIGPTKFQIAVNPYVSIPSEFGHGNSQRVDPNIKFPFSQELNEHWDIEGMESFFYPTEGDHRNLDWQNSLVLNRSWGRQKNAFIEYVSDVFEYGPTTHIIHFGAAYRPTRRQQMDVQFGFRMNNAAPIAFFGFGYSFLLGNLRTPRLTPSLYKK